MTIVLVFLFCCPPFCIPVIIMARRGRWKDGQEPTPVIGSQKDNLPWDRVYFTRIMLRSAEESSYNYELMLRRGFLLKEPSPEVHHQRVSRRFTGSWKTIFATTRPQRERPSTRRAGCGSLSPYSCSTTR